MESTWKLVKVVDMDERFLGFRMLHEDRRGRLCVRYQKQWRLVTERRECSGRHYRLEGLI